MARALSSAPLVGIIMGSQSDWETMVNAADTLKNFNANRGARPDDQVEQMLELLRAAW